MILNVNAINQVIILSLMMLLGYYAKKRKFLDEKVNKGLSDLLINITFPCLLVQSFQFKFNQEMLNKSMYILMYSFIIHFILILISKLIFIKYKDKEQQALRFAIVFSNAAFMGFPVLEGLYGKIALFYASFFNIPFNLLIFSYGIILFSGEKNVKKIVKTMVNPTLIAIFIGFIMFLFSISFPLPVKQTLDKVGGMTTPIAMLLVGSMLAESPVKEVFLSKTVYFATLIKLVLVPALTLGFLLLINADPFLIKISVIIEAMPSATLVAVFAEKYDGDKGMASKVAFMTTVVSIITIPLVVALI